MIVLEPFLEEDFERLISWIESEEMLIQFAGPQFSYPLTRDQLLIYNNTDIRKAFKVRLKSTGEIIGHCELNFKNPIPRLSRILIGHAEHRDKGFGRNVVQQLLAIVFRTTAFESVDISVFDWNVNAISSYKRVGFQINHGFETEMMVGTKTWKAYNMIITKDIYLHSNHTSEL